MAVEPKEEAPVVSLESGGTETAGEEAQAQRIAARLGIPFIDLIDFPINHDLFRAIPVDLMFRYNFVPWKEENGRLVVVMADPSDVLMVDELEVLLGRPLGVCVGR